MPASLLPDDALARLNRIDAACLRFEAEWERGASALEEHLAAAPADERPDLLRELLLVEWRQRHRRGALIDVTAYRARFAGHAAVEDAWQQWQRWRDTSTGGAPATEPTAVSHLGERCPTVLAGYEDIQRLGQGGMGVVYRAVDPQLRRPVALKMIRPGLIGPERLARFRAEAEMLARLTHPHIVQVHRWAEHGGEPVLVLEYVAGGSLEGRLPGGPLDPGTAARLVAVLAWAVQHAHEHGIVHRDLKPANVLLAPPVEGNLGTVLGAFPKVGDFGLARFAEGDGIAQTASNQVLGTPAYMAPEQAAGRSREVGPAADVWALGVILYRCLTGELPFAGDSVLETLEKVKQASPAPPRSLAPTVPPELETICLRCLTREPAARPTARELATQLERFLSGERPPAPRRRRWRLAAGIGVALLLGAAALTWRFGWGAPAAGDGPVNNDKRSSLAESVPQIKTFRLDVFRVVSLRETVPEGTVSRDREPDSVPILTELAFAGHVRAELEFAEPVHAYLIVFNANGGEPQLCWPVNAEKVPDRTLAPPRTQRIRYPDRIGSKGGPVLFCVDDEPRGGLQAFAVLASRNPLPPFAEWHEVRGRLPWRREADWKGVWLADAEGVYPVLPGRGVVRGREEEMAVPPLRPLCRALLSGAPGEAVEILAVPSCHGPVREEARAAKHRRSLKKPRPALPPSHGTPPTGPAACSSLDTGCRRRDNTPLAPTPVPEPA